MPALMLAPLLAAVLTACPGQVTGITPNPGSTTVGSGSTVGLSATVSGQGSFDPGVMWSVASGGGSLSSNTGSNVIYTAPNVTQTTNVVVNATATGNPAVSSAVNITVNAPGPPPPPPRDTTAPTIVSITPDKDSIGVAKDVKIVIKFSEPMNTTSTKLAYLSSSLPPVDFNWSEGDTKLEIDPKSDLVYTEDGKEYTFILTNAATDLAGNALTQVSSTFRTFRELTKTIESSSALDGHVRSDGVVNAACSSDYICVGDSGAVDNAQYKGFLSFNLSGLETDGLTTSDRITSATLRIYQGAAPLGTPYTDLKQGSKGLIVAHASYGSPLTAGDFNTAPMGKFPETGQSTLVAWKTFGGGLDVARDDWDKRVTRDNRSQYVLFFPLATDGDGVVDVVRLNPGEMANSLQLVVNFLVP